MGTSSLQDGVAPLALDLCPAGTPGTTPGTGMLPGIWNNRFRVRTRQWKFYQPSTVAMNRAVGAACGLNEWSPGRFCSDGVLTVEGAVGRRGRRPSTMGTSSLQDGVAPLALDLCPAGTPGTTPGTGMLPGNLEQPISSADTPVDPPSPCGLRRRGWFAHCALRDDELFNSRNRLSNTLPSGLLANTKVKLLTRP